MNVEWSSSVLARSKVHAALGEPVRLAIVDTLALGDASPGEIGEALGLATNLVAHHLNVLRDAGVVERSRSEGDRRRTYLRLVPTALAALASPPPRPVTRVVFVCTHNSARSQLAAAQWALRSRIPAASAGTHPADRVHPRAVRIARRHGLSLDRARTAHVADVIGREDLVIAVCDRAHERLGEWAADRLHWSVPDPAKVGTDDAFEAAYGEIAGRIDRLAPTLTSGADMTEQVRRDDGRPVVLFLCVHNAGRSQMALGFFEHLARDRTVAWSGGSEPGIEVNRAAVAAMAERGIDISGEFPKPWTDEVVRAADVVITMGCGDACPIFPGKRYLDWTLDDPAGQTVEQIRPIRDEIERRVRALLDDLGVAVTA
jgi:protein-tyrosine-phosphatase